MFLPELHVPVERTLPSGNLNANSLFASPNGELFIHRTENPVGRAAELPFVAAEYQGVGFLQNTSNGFRLRSSREQHAFAMSLADAGIPTIVPRYSTKELQVIPFMEGCTDLAQLLHTGDPNGLLATHMVITELADAHKKEMAIGDRWGPNELVFTDGSVRFIDFDIEIWGPEAKEFEMASLLYFSSYYLQLGNPEMLPGMTNLYKQHLSGKNFESIYDIDVLKRYVTNYANYFATPQKYSWENPEQSLTFFNTVTNL